MSIHHLPLVLAIAASTLVVSPALAQEERRPNRAVFGEGRETAEEELIATGSGGIGYDTNARLNAFDAGVAVPATSASDSGYSLLAGALSYSLQKQEFGLRMTGGSSRRDYYRASQEPLTNYNAGVGASFTPSSRTSFSVNQTMSYQPFSLYSLFPEVQTPALAESGGPGVDYYTSAQNYLSLDSSAVFIRQLSRRSTFTADYNRNSRDTPGSQGNYLSQTGHARFTRQLKKGLALRLGYGYTSTKYSNVSEDFGYHLLDTGVDYSNELSFSRRTTVSFSMGASATSYAGDTHLYAIGNVNLHHEIGRTWDLRAAYDRNVQFMEIYAGPVQYQSVSTQLTGLITRRLSVYTGVGATSGSFGQSSTGSGFGDVYSSTGLGAALNRYLSLNVNYSLHWYSHDDVLSLPLGVTSNMRRHTVSATIGAWAPVFQRGRRRDAAR